MLFLCNTDDRDVHTARFVLQRAVDYHRRLQEMSETLELDDAKSCSDLEAEWTAMRITLVGTLPPVCCLLCYSPDLRPGKTTSLKWPNICSSRPAH